MDSHSGIISLSLIIPGRPWKTGEPVEVHIEVRNISGTPFWMVGVIDGSETGFRYPHYKPVIEGPGDIVLPEIPWCGNVAPLRMQDFRYLLPGEGFDPTLPENGAAFGTLRTFSEFIPVQPGIYDFQLTLSTLSKNDEEWLGVADYPGMQDVLARLALVPRLKTESAKIQIKVK